MEKSDSVMAFAVGCFDSGLDFCFVDFDLIFWLRRSFGHFLLVGFCRLCCWMEHLMVVLIWFLLFRARLRQDLKLKVPVGNEG